MFCLIVIGGVGLCFWELFGEDVSIGEPTWLVSSEVLEVSAKTLTLVTVFKWTLINVSIQCNVTINGKTDNTDRRSDYDNT